MKKGEGKLTLYCLVENDEGRPFVKYSMIVREDLQFSMWCREVPIAKARVAHLCKNNVVHSYEGFLNMLTNLRVMSETDVPPPKDTVKYCASLLTEAVQELDELVAPKISFVVEQLKLALKPPRGKLYFTNIS